jgi:hypothetical protein
MNTGKRLCLCKWMTESMIVTCGSDFTSTSFKPVKSYALLSLNYPLLYFTLPFKMCEVQGFKKQPLSSLTVEAS